MLMRDIEQAISLADTAVHGLGGLKLNKAAIAHLCRRLAATGETVPVRILELGGGPATLFWASLDRLGFLPIQVKTLEHDATLVSKLRELVEPGPIEVLQQPLKQISDDDWERMYADPARAIEIWREIGTDVPESQYKHYSIHNTFYGEVQALPWEAIDVLIVDGPHGNGRALAFPLFASMLTKGTYVLIDDFDHYPFLSDLRRLYSYRELHRVLREDERWVLLQIIEQFTVHEQNGT